MLASFLNLLDWGGISKEGKIGIVAILLSLLSVIQTEFHAIQDRREGHEDIELQREQIQLLQRQVELLQQIRDDAAAAVTTESEHFTSDILEDSVSATPLEGEQEADKPLPPAPPDSTGYREGDAPESR